MKLRILSVLLIFLLVASIVIPPVAAEPAPLLVVAHPITVKITADGIGAIVTIFAATEIGKKLGVTWDGINEHINNLKTGLENKLNNLFSAKNKWIDANSNEFAAMLDFECLVSSEYGNNRQDNKWYHIAKWTPEGIKVNPIRISEETAAKVMKLGGNIFTTTEKRARNCVNRISKIQVNQTNIEIHGLREEGYFEHHHPKKTDKIHYPQHCWFWMR